jgi:hypothetical protein
LLNRIVAVQESASGGTKIHSSNAAKYIIIQLYFKELFNYKMTLLFTTHYSLSHSVRRFFTGFASAALIACELTVINAIANESNPATKNIHQLSSIL